MTVRAEIPCVTILLATYNGAEFLSEQLQSYLEQSHKCWRLLASDDGSVDATPDILKAFQAENSDRVVEVVNGPSTGVTQNFLSLLLRVAEPAATEFTAFSDQDDRWLPHKLERALAQLADVPSDQPALYCSRSWVCDAALTRLHHTRHYPRSASFPNALIENIAQGHTIVLNAAATRLAQQTAFSAKDVYAHDWWLYLLISGAGGRVIYDSEPGTLYRQHGTNQIGDGTRLRSRLTQPVAVMKGTFRHRVDGNLAALRQVADQLKPEHRRMLDDFDRARQSNGMTRFWRLMQLGVYRQTFRGQLGFWGAACLGKV